eukprot:TRINITY_DN2606_c1_g1_i1.p1 TRINITY_DN2606_c1_g1~~TRINITY_DN2606_c1_g1_i1.p1  ORF type:complete len:259 (+),score=6.56 TRINITY_DN2606_c1_g1_i1:80-856(+)
MIIAPPKVQQMGTEVNHHPGKWKQDLCECSPCEPCMLGFFWPQSHACARAKMDNSSCCMHCLTSGPCLTSNYMRANYGIGTNQDCCEDIILGKFCLPCHNRRMLVESEHYKLSETSTHPGQYNRSLFSGGKFKGVSGMGNYTPGSGEQQVWQAGGLGDCGKWGCTGQFMYACFFPQCAAARTRQYLDGSDCCFNVFFNTPCNLYYTTRHYYGIRGDWIIDLFVSMFCYSCAIDRIYREIIICTTQEYIAGLKKKCGCC